MHEETSQAEQVESFLVVQRGSLFSRLPSELTIDPDAVSFSHIRHFHPDFQDREATVAYILVGDPLEDPGPTQNCTMLLAVSCYNPGDAKDEAFFSKKLGRFGALSRLTRAVSAIHDGDILQEWWFDLFPVDIPADACRATPGVDSLDPPPFGFIYRKLREEVREAVNRCLEQRVMDSLHSVDSDFSPEATGEFRRIDEESAHMFHSDVLADELTGGGPIPEVPSDVVEMHSTHETPLMSGEIGRIENFKVVCDNVKRTSQTVVHRVCAEDGECSGCNKG